MAPFLSKMEYVRLGKITKVFGLKGQVRCFSMTDFPEKRFHLGTKLSLFDELSGERNEVTITYFRFSGSFFYLGFEEITDCAAAERYVNRFIEVDKETAPLPKGFYRQDDLVGCKVLSEEGIELGQVKAVLSYAPTKTLRVARPGKPDFFVPFVDGVFVKSVDIAKKTILIKVMSGLL